ncbi:metal-dependent hydrolase [Corallococcus aberystwythensis]|uniref:Metal-dependent hydrolase n=1 Tax=Corallococcus aberystwythensis TaxID=2316722 RepID=A0A3A8QVC8_9BACT|nr:metal-dependent hydrolase [Corallococcus aberystwythensis]RKH67084.1 metal-dependent hydrolase [Corallococcus aberystwythensis]
MASIGHVAIGMAAARAWVGNDATRARLVRAMVAFSALSMLPDADVIAFAFGIPYEAPWGHRGASHSFVFALWITAVIVAIARRAGAPPLRTFICVGFVALSHGLLDILTDGGLGCALFWPFSYERIFAPVTPIPVAPIGLYMFSGRGLYVVMVELLLFAPFFLYATFPRKKRLVESTR